MDFKKKEIIGMIHLAGPDTVEKAMEEIRIYEEEGLSGIIVENYHGGLLDVIDTLEMLQKHPTRMSLGINILPNEYATAFEMATKYNAQFIQLDYMSGSYIGVDDFDITDFLDHWSHTIDIKVFGGVWPKYYTPVDGSDLKEDLFDAIMWGDGVVVTGSGTGMETPLEKIQLFRETMDTWRGKKIRGDLKPLIVGAGLTPLNVVESLQYAQGGIVGSAFKPRGRTNQMVDRDLVKVFMDQVAKI